MLGSNCSPWQILPLSIRKDETTESSKRDTLKVKALLD